MTLLLHPNVQRLPRFHGVFPTLGVADQEDIWCTTFFTSIAEHNVEAQCPLEIVT